MAATQYVDILYAEDERDIRDLASFTIRFAGYSVLGASNGEELVKLLVSHSVLPKLILLDVRMPRMTGYEACRLIKRTPEFKNIPVVFLSARGQESEIQQGLEAGGEEYWLKPFAPDQLRDKLNAVMHKIRLGIYDKSD